MTSRLVTSGGDFYVTLGGDFYVTDVGGVVEIPTPDVDVGAPYSLDLCVGWVKVAEVVAGTFDGIIRNLALGEWSLTGYVADVDFQAGYDITDVDTIRAVQGSAIVFGGYVAPVASGVGGLDIQQTADGDTYTLKGADLWNVPASRVAYPTPATEAPWANAHDDRIGVASTVAAGYLRDNAGSGALAARQYPSIAIVDLATGATGTWSARLQPLDQLIARVCTDGGITCRTMLGFDGTVTFSFGAPTDRSATTVLSDQADLTSLHRVNTPAIATYVIAGGQGELTARTFAAAGSATGAARREVFSDQTSLATSTEVAQAASSTLAKDAANLTVQAQITDTTAQSLDYIADYDVGDTITVEIDQVRYPVVVNAVTFHFAKDRQVVRPVLGVGSLNIVAGLLTDVANLQARLQTQIA